MGLDKSRVVQTRLLRDPENRIYCFGSGYVIALGFVLTAAHVLEPQKGTPAKQGDQCEVRLLDSVTWSPAFINWVDPELEVAVVVCACTASEPVKWGRVTGVHPVDWMAIGFPVASVNDAGREAEQAWGEASPVSAADSGRLALTVDSRTAVKEHDESGWAGLSGSAVFSGDHLVGVIQADPKRYEKSLEARRAETFLSVPVLAGLLGAPSCDDVRGDAPEAGVEARAGPAAPSAPRQVDPVAAVATSLREAVRSRAPILIAIEQDTDHLTDAQFSLIERHLTVTLGAAAVAAAVEAADVALRAGSIDEVVEAGQRIWTGLREAEPRLDNLLDCISDDSVRQPVAWCGRAGLLARLGAALQIAHTGRGGDAGFVSVAAGAHYFLPVPQQPDSRTMAYRYRTGTAEPTVARRWFSDDAARGTSFVREASAADIAVFVDPNPQSTAMSELARLVASNPLARSRAAFAFAGGTPDAEEVDALLDTVPFVSFADVNLAEPDVLATLESCLRAHAATFALPSIAGAVRGGAVRRAIAADHVASCLWALQWSVWSWIGLPLFARAYEEVPPAAYPHLMRLRSVASHDWYFNRRKEIPDAYAADTLARADLPEEERFHLYLSGAGGTGKSCFLRYVHDELAERDSAVPIWYRVDAPSSSWESIERRVREETVKAIRDRFDDKTADDIGGISGGLGIFLREASMRLRQARPGVEIVVFIDQLERTFESGDQPNDVRLEGISNAIVDLLKTVGVGRGTRIFIASRKQYLPDFLGSSRTATEAGLEFNVLKKIGDDTERVGFVWRIVSWCSDNQLIDPKFSIDANAASTLVQQVDGHPLNMMLALIQLLSANPRGTVTEAQLRNQYRPWARLFDLDLRAAAHDDLDWYFLLAMAHARTEIVGFDEVWWRLRMVNARLTGRVDDLRPPRVIERLWLFGYLGRTLHARPDADNPAGFVEFFHANLRDYILREVMARAGAAFGVTGRRLGTPQAWRALDRLAARAHDWEQTQQLLPADDVRILMEHRHQVIEPYALPGLQDPRRFALLFVRDPDPAREGLCDAATECFAFSALVHNERGRWVFETLFPDADARVKVCERWLESATSDTRTALLRYLVGLETEPARNILISTVLEKGARWDAETARTLASILAEPLYAARYRNGFVAGLLEVAAGAGSRAAGPPAPRAESFIVASCGGDRDALVSLISYCSDWFSADESITAERALAMLNSARVDEWLASSAADETFAGAAPIEPSSQEEDFVLGLMVGENLRSEIDQAQLEAWSGELRRRLGVPFPDLRLTRGEAEPPVGDDRRDGAAPSAADPDAIELWTPTGRISSNVFRSDRVCIVRRDWDATGDPLPSDAVKGYDVAGEEDVVWVSLSESQRGAFPFPVRDFRAAVDDWLERHARRSFDVLFDDHLLVELAREIVASPGGRTRRRGLDWRRLRRVAVALIEEGVPFGPRRDAILDVLAGLADTVAQPDLLVQKVREHLKSDICHAVADEAGQITVLLLDRELEQTLADLVADQQDRRVLALEADDALQLAAAARRGVERLLAEHAPPPVIVTLPSLRRSLALLLRQFDHRVPILSFTELVPDIITVPGGVVGSPDLVRARRPAEPEALLQPQPT